jgi:hybrid cluster-associated redox disulfide protein
MKKEKNKITKDMTFREVVITYPGSAEFLFKRGFHCIGCPMASMESIEDGAIAHGEDPEKLINDLNKFLEKK